MLVVLVVLMFLRTIRATIIAGVALPLSLIATFGVMWFAGFSLDNLSLMALTIGTGFVVDDAIVMIENIVRHIEEGESPLDAALRGAREIGFTVISLTVSLIAVFIPLLFMTGLVGRMFREFALTLTIAVVVSAIVSLTLTPMMCSRILRHQAAKHAATASRAFQPRRRWHRRRLWAQPRMGARPSAADPARDVGDAGRDRRALCRRCPKGFLPSQDTGLITAVSEAGTEVSFAEMQRLQKQVEAAIKADPDVTGVVSVLGVSRINPTPNAGSLTITLRPRDERHRQRRRSSSIGCKRAVAPIPGMTVYFQPVQDIQISTRASRAQYQYTLVGTDAGDVADWSLKLAQRLRQDRRLLDVASEAQDGGLRMQVQVDRETAGRLGVSMQAINDTLNDAFGQRQISTIYAQANQYRVILEASPSYQRDPSSLGKLYVTGSSTSTGTAATVGNTAAGSTNSNTSPTPNAVTGSAQVPLSTFARFDHITAPLIVRPSGAIPVGHDQLQSAARRGARATRSRPSPARKRAIEHADPR